MQTLLQDIRYALRALRRTPGFAVAVVCTLALAIGANTAIYSVVDGVLLRPAPIDNADRVMVVWETDRKSGTTREPSSLPDFIDFQQRARTFAHLGAFTSTNVDITPANGDPQRLVAVAMTADFPQVLGFKLAAGRMLEESETRPGGARAVLISSPLATTVFGSSADAIGKTIRLSDVDWTVAGVVDPAADFGIRQVLGSAAYGRGFADHSERARVDVWIGLRADAASLPRDTHPIVVLGRLAPPSNRVDAQTELTTITADLERAYPSNAARGAFVEPLPDVVFGDVRVALYTLLGAVALVLLVACANVANLLLVRSAGRAREVTVRVTLGAGTGRLARQFLTEGAVLTFIGAGLGVFLAYAGLDALRRMAPAGLPRIDTVAIDARVLAITTIVTVVVALVVGLVPMLRARRVNVESALRAGGGRGASAGRDHRRVRHGLIVSEMAMASMLMVGAGLMIKSLWQLQRVDPGFAAAGVLKADYSLPSSRYPRPFSKFPHWVEQEQFDRELQTRLAALPGVEAVALASNHPLDAGFTSSISVVGREAEARDWPEPAIRIVSPGYFATMRVGLRDGRSLAESDNGDAPPVLMINQSAAERFFKGAVAIGQKINLWGAGRTVVGIVPDEHFHGLASAGAPGVYLPIGQVPPQGGHSVLMRVRGDPASYAAALRATVRAIDARLPLFGVEPLPQTLEQSIGQQRFTMFVLAAFAFVTLLLAAVGVHGVLSYTVTQRTPELGIRMALGASSDSVRTLVLSQGAKLAVLGLTIGLGGALVLSRLLAHLLYGTGARDPLTFVAVGGAMTLVALVATYLPARRASRVDPLAAMRAE